MRILVHDYVGHPFQPQLSRELATRGHEVLHVYCGSFSTPRGTLRKLTDDAPGFDVEAIDLGAEIPKNGFVRRFRMESEYGRRLVEVCRRFRPEVVLSGNTPSIPQWRVVRHCKRQDIRYVYWVQDIYGIAAYRLLKRRIPVVGHVVGQYFMALDRKSARNSDALVVITDDFIPVFQKWGIDREKIHVIHNWAVLEELVQRPRENGWSQQFSLGPGPRFIYTGTLAMKHNPALLLALAKMLDEQGDRELGQGELGQGEMIVVSQGSGVEWLQREAEAAGIRSLRCMGFQPFEVMADVMGSADVLVAVLEPDAGVFSVPSKVLSYLCAGRAVLAAMPGSNLAARLITDHQAGTVVEPDDIEGFTKAAAEMIASPDRCAEFGRGARRYAEENFDIRGITDQFERALGIYE